MRLTEFDKIADIYETTIPEHVSKHYLNKRCSFIKKYSTAGWVLDVGSGTGTLDSLLVDGGFKLVGLDLSLAMLQQTKRRKGHFLVCADSSALPFKSGCFDLAASVVTMHHIADPSKVAAAIKEMVRVLRSGGRIIIWDHNPLNIYWGIFMKRLPQDRDKTRLIPLKEIVRNFKKSGILSIETYRLGFVPDFIPPSMLRIAQILEKIVENTPFLNIWCAHNIAVGKKGGG